MAATETVTSFIHITNAVREVFHALTWAAGTGNIVDDELGHSSRRRGFATS
ncbi:hypothetical protein [Actinoplanes utahensis]|uniref:hypothetical protein n=1 Tax=Actinoplanes utahensis TaxID=1869 RepID=UPI000B06DD21|nr:hypothetical protein [Actinoplanes utahensis]GIF35212.1 hypothetical protein Aut01nite_81980 [Actinoplanes utahensis]